MMLLVPVGFSSMLKKPLDIPNARPNLIFLEKYDGVQILV